MSENMSTTITSVSHITQLPQDILLRVVAEYLKKREQYQLFSTCSSWKFLLHKCRTFHIYSKPIFESSHCSWELFKTSEEHRVKLLRCLGLNSPNDSSFTRPFNFTLNYEDAMGNKELLLQYVKLIKTITIPSVQIGANFPYSMNLSDPTLDSLTRFLQSQWLRAGTVRTLQDMWNMAQKFSRSLVSPSTDVAAGSESVGVVASFATLRGVYGLYLKKDGSLFIDIHPTDPNAKKLHRLRINDYYNRQSMVTDVSSLRGIPDVTLLNCHEISDVSPLAEAESLTLRDVSCSDISMLGNVRKLTVKYCENVTTCPVPTVGKGQEWEFKFMELRDVSSLANLEKLTLICCENITDISMLGSVKKLSVIACENVNLTTYPVPTKDKGQDWKFEDMNIADVSALANVKKLSIMFCFNVTDLSMLGNVQYLNIANCHNAVKMPIPLLGRKQYWMISNATDILALEQFHGLENLKLSHCEISWIATKHITFITLQLLDCQLGEFISDITVDTFIISQQPILIFGNNVHITTLDIRFMKNQPLSLTLSSSLKASLRSLKVTDTDGRTVAELKPPDFADIEVLTMVNGVIQSNTSLLPVHNNTFKYFDNQRIRAAIALWDIDTLTALQLYGDIANWDVSPVTDMGGLFFGRKNFNSNINNWDVSNVTDMSCMFYGASAFNQPLGSWAVRKVTNMNAMFQEASLFNQPLSNWDVSQVTNMNGMFKEASSFNQSLHTWNMSNVTFNRDMFVGVPSFDDQRG